LWKSPRPGVSIAQVKDDYGENTRVLIEARVIPGELPEPYQQVIEDLSAEEVEALISIKARFDEANQNLGGSGDAGFIGMVLPL
jgi:hypothetical protein